MSLNTHPCATLPFVTQMAPESTLSALDFQKSLGSWEGTPLPNLPCNFLLFFLSDATRWRYFDTRFKKIAWFLGGNTSFFLRCHQSRVGIRDWNLVSSRLDFKSRPVFISREFRLDSRLESRVLSLYFLYLIIISNFKLF